MKCRNIIPNLYRKEVTNINEDFYCKEEDKVMEEEEKEGVVVMMN